MGSVEQAGIFTLRIIDEVTSTNDEIKRAIDSGEDEGFALGAYVQTNGYGRQGRTWCSPLGGVYVSCLLRPHVSSQILPTLSLVAVLSVRRALEKFLSDETFRHITIKWPNDLIYCIDDHTPSKLCGISLETYLKAVCVGIGLNVFPPVYDNDDRRDANSAYSYLSELEGTKISKERRTDSQFLAIEQVRQAVLDSFSDAYKVWLSKGFMPFLDEYEACSYLTGRQIFVENLDGSLLACGNVLGINDQGALILQSVDSDEHLFITSGEAHISSISRTNSEVHLL